MVLNTPGGARRPSSAWIDLYRPEAEDPGVLRKTVLLTQKEVGEHREADSEYRT